MISCIPRVDMIFCEQGRAVVFNGSYPERAWTTSERHCSFVGGGRNTVNFHPSATSGAV